MLRLYNDFDRRRASCEAGQKRTGWDGWASTRASLAKPEWGTQKAIERRTRVANPAACAAFHPSIDRLEEQPSGGLGWPTQQLAPCFIRPSIASRECPQSAKAKGKTRQGTLLPNKNDNHGRSRRLEASAKEHRANMSLANRGQQQTMPTKLDPWGGTPELRRQISPRQLRATIEWGGTRVASPNGFPRLFIPRPMIAASQLTPRERAGKRGTRFPHQEPATEGRRADSNVCKGRRG